MPRKKNVTIYSVYGIAAKEMAASLKTIQGLRFSEPRVNHNDFCEVELINVTPKQWQAIMRLY